MGARAGARRSQDRGKAMVAEVRAMGGRRRVNGVNPDLDRPISRGVHKICPLRFLPSYNTLQWLYFEKFTRRLRRIHH
jgi:hypothetical protein